MTAKKNHWRAVLFIAVISLGIGCKAGGDGDTPIDDTPCACAVGAKRCNADQIQVCEGTNPDCPTWGPATSCPTNHCDNGSCGTNCQDSCPGGTSRCAGDTSMEVCRIGPSGCLEWVKQACPTTQFCGMSMCQPPIPCDPTCPNGYSCKPNGVCAGGSPTGLILDVKTVDVSGKVTMNGMTPSLGVNCPGNPTISTAQIHFTETTKGYVTSLYTECRDNTFSFSGKIYPGTYTVRVNNPNSSDWSNIPSAPSVVQSFVVSDSMVLTADKSGLILDVKTVNVAGKITLSGATPSVGMNCPGNPTISTGQIQFTETTKGYVTNLYTQCRDTTFSFAGKIYPGTYTVRVNNPNSADWSNIPSAASVAQSFVVASGMAFTVDKSGLIFDVKTVNLSGKITLGGGAPSVGMNCPGNPTISTGQVQFTETTKGYVTSLYTSCGDPTFSFAGKIYPGTYTIRVNNPNSADWSNIPSAASVAQSFVVSDSMALTADKSGLILDVKTVNVSGKITLSGATPSVGTNCPGNPTISTGQIHFTEMTKGYVTSLYTSCGDASFSFSGKLYPGTYTVRVNNPNSADWSNIPSAANVLQSFIVSSGLALIADKSGLLLDVKTINVSGKITLSGATPSLGTNCPGNPTISTGQLQFTETTKGYVTSLYTSCGDPTFGFSGKLYPGTYTVRVNNPNSADWSNIPSAASVTQSFIASSGLDLSASKSGIIFDVKTVDISGKITLNGMPPMRGPNCPGNPTISTAQIQWSDMGQGYVTSLYSSCQDNAFQFSGKVYPGTYSIRVNNPNSPDWSNIPSAANITQSYKAVSQIQIP